MNINKNGLIATNIREGDEVVSVRLTKKSQEIVIVTAQGKAIRFNSDDCRDMGRNATGVRGIRLSEGDRVVGMEPVTDDGLMLVISEKGYGKKSSIEEYRVQSRGGKGIITYKVTEKTGNLVGTTLIADNEDLLIMTDHGMVIRVMSTEIPTLSRATSGVRLMRSTTNSIIDFTVADHYLEEDDEEVEGEPQDTDTVTTETAGGEANEPETAAEDIASEDKKEDNGQEE